MMVWKYLQAGLVALSVLSSTTWGQQDQGRERGMPESVRQEVEEMLKAGATRQQVREFLENSKKNMRSRGPANEPGKGKRGEKQGATAIHHFTCIRSSIDQRRLQPGG